MATAFAGRIKSETYHGRVPIKSMWLGYLGSVAESHHHHDGGGAVRLGSARFG